MFGDHRIIRRGMLCLAAVFTLLAAADHASAQLNNGNRWPKPRLNAVTPVGGNPGSTFEVTFSGSELDDPNTMVFSHPGIKAAPIIPPLPKVDPKKKPAKEPKRLPVTKFTVTIDGNVPPGFYDVRMGNDDGITNPRIFVVDKLPQILEKEANNDVEQAQKVPVGCTIDGVIGGGTDVDYYSFEAKKGQRIVISCLAPTIDSQMHPEIRIFNAAQRQIGYHRPLPLEDGVIDLTVPADGLYFIRLNQFTYTSGGRDYFYRMSISTGPWIDAVFPAALEPGKATQVTLYGRNLPGGQLDPTAVLDNRVLEKATVSVTAPANQDQLQYTGYAFPTLGLLDGFEYRLTTPNGISNPNFFAFAHAPVVIENDANDTADKAQLIKTPCEVAGRVDKRGDRDWFVFDGKKGDVYMIDVVSHRYGPSTDMYFSLHRLDKKQQITLQDDDNTFLDDRTYYNITRDPQAYRFVVPEDGKYHINVGSHVADNFNDPRHTYMLRIKPEAPDFRLVVMPPEDWRQDTLVLGQGGSETFRVFADRRDGFIEDIVLEIEGLPGGVTCPPQVLSGTRKSAYLTVTAADNAAPFTGAVKVRGTAAYEGKKIVRHARPANVVWPTQPNQNIPTITRLERELMLAVRGKAPGKLLAKGNEFTVSLGDKIEIPLQFVRSDAKEFKANFQVTRDANDFPQNVNFPNLTFAPGKDEQKAVLTVPANSVPGTYNIVFRGFANFPKADGNGKSKNYNTILPSTPVKLTILPKSVANLSLNTNNVNIKLGAKAEVIVRVARLHNYRDEFKVQLVLPKGASGLNVAPATIAKGQNEVKLVLDVPANSKVGNINNITIQAVAVVNGNVSLLHETKLNVNVVK